MSRTSLATVGALVMLAGASPGSAQAAADASPEANVAVHAGCPAPLEFLDDGTRLPHVQSALTAGGLRVLVLGSASGLGSAGNSGPRAAWPHRFVAHLREQAPGLQISMTLRAQRGSTVAMQLAILSRALLEQPVDLVVWQTGTVDAVRGSDPQELAATLEEGLHAIRAAQADLVLMDQQFSRFLRANTAIDAYRDMMRMFASGSGTPLLRRYDLMQAWAESDELDLERTPKDKLADEVDRLHDCLGRALAQLILRSGTTSTAQSR